MLIIPSKGGRGALEGARERPQVSLGFILEGAKGDNLL